MSARKHTNVASTSLASRPSSSRVVTSRTSRGPARLHQGEARPIPGRFSRQRTQGDDALRRRARRFAGTSSSDDDDDAPAWRRAGFDVGFTTDSSGKFIGDGQRRLRPPPPESKRRRRGGATGPLETRAPSARSHR